MLPDVLIHAAQALGAAATQTAVLPIGGPVVAAGAAQIGGGISRQLTLDVDDSLDKLAQGDTEGVQDMIDLGINPVDEVIHASAGALKGVPLVGDALDIVDSVSNTIDDILFGWI